ncbi:MAG: hypothetical protein CSA62_06675 [Planctomycetota bacterium]|nr:MAG: hypothetical protein CSA62_06675 [Planctomycetota bacterium]
MNTPRFSLGLMAVASLSLASCGERAPTTFPDSPNGTMTTLAKELNSGNARVLWDALPNGYQKDVSDLVHSFGKSMDAEVHQKLFGALRSALDLAAEKKSIAIEMAKGMGLESDNLKKLEAQYGSIVALLKEAAESDLADAKKVASLDLASFLGGEGSSLFSKFQKVASAWGDDNPLARLAKMEFKAGEEVNGVVPVEAWVDGKVDGPAAPFKKVDGKWFFADLANDWPEMMKEAKGRIAKLDLSKDKKQILDSLGKLEELIVKLKPAKTAKDVQQIAMSSVMDFLPAMGFLGKSGFRMHDRPAVPVQQPKLIEAKKDAVKGLKKDAMKGLKKGMKKAPK